LASTPANPSGSATAPSSPVSVSPQISSRPPEQASIQLFLTDGSIARLCDEMSRLTGVPLWLTDIDGRAVVPITPKSGEAPWQMLDAQKGAERAFSLVGKPMPNRLDLFKAPMRTTSGDVGAIVMPVDWGSDDPAERRSLERAVLILANSAAESCQGQIDVRRRLGELDALFRLSSLLVQADQEDRVLQSALDLALDALRLDAGSIAVLDEAGDLQTKASRGLSQLWLRQQMPLSTDGALRSRALAGETVWVADLLDDQRIVDIERISSENIRSLLMAGLCYHGRAAGLLRLYSRTPRSFTEEESDLLRAIADQAAMALAHNRLRKLREQDQAMQRQLKLAADVQRRMLPRSLPKFDRFDIAARYEPSFQLGGDFYDVETLHGKLAFAVGDVVGKGVPAALIMSAVRSALRAYSSSAATLGELLSKVNIATVRDTLESEFVTLLVGLIDPATCELIVSCAGHDPVIIFRPRPGQLPEVFECGNPGLVAGVDPAQEYEETRHQLQTGDVLIAYTDGLSDAVDFDGRKFSRARVERTVLTFLAAEPTAPAGRVIEHIMWTLRQFCGIRMSVDDVTIVAIRVK
jgi:phosphoserine phosphatase RsbU/P